MVFDREQLKDFKERLDKASRILITGHKSPDGDAVGAVLAFKAVLENLGKEVTAIYTDKLPSYYSFLPGFPSFVTTLEDLNFDQILVLDCGSTARTGLPAKYPDLFGGNNWMVIDHHISEKGETPLKIADFEASSVSEILFWLFRKMDWNISGDMATCLLCGIYFDTGSFQHSNTSANTLKTASELLGLGARIPKIAKNLYNTKSVSSLRLWGRVLSRINYDKSLGLATSIISASDLVEIGASIEDLGDVVNLVNSIPGLKASILFSERDDEIKGSVRIGTAGEGVDATKIAGLFGGGGHTKAAGFSVKGKLEVVNGNWQIVNGN